jgi:23S rRNA pseudouridine1911/1915/1917 synthase
LKLDYQVKASEAGFAVEKVLRKNLGFSRGMIRKLKRHTGVLVNKKTVLLNQRLQEGDTISVDLQFGGLTDAQPQSIPVNIIYEDRHFLVINKPPDMLVHPLKHEPENTLANAILHHYLQSDTEPVFRPVSRLDRNTSGLVLIAKYAHAGFRLAHQIGAGKLQREYIAVVHGLIKPSQGSIDLPIARCPDSKIKHMVHPDGKKAITNYCVEKYLLESTVLKLFPKTGRTHQIRVHMSHIGHPLVGDALYGGREIGIKRQALHCRSIKLIHPITGETIVLEAPLPEDIQRLINNRMP